MTPFHEEPGVTLYLGDCVETMRSLPENSVDAIVTDPPYLLHFMGRGWDHAEEPYAFHSRWAREALRVLKPGGHLLAFGGTRTYHRLTCALEDAGFEIRDCLMWLYGSGFPKSLDVSKAIDKAAGAERAIVGKSNRHVSGKPEQRTEGMHGSATFAETVGMGAVMTAPATDDAKRWAGWGTALKPAHEPIVGARKPLAERNVAANVLAHGTGAINVDGCRVGGGVERTINTNPGMRGGAFGAGEYDPKSFASATTIAGRWPANVILSHADGCERAGVRRVRSSNATNVGDRNEKNKVYGRGLGGGAQSVAHADADGLETVEAWTCVEGCPVRMLDEQSGELTSGANPTRRGSDKFRGIYSDFKGQEQCAPARGIDIGGASRFFYTAKADRKDRDGSKHPTVKPTDLMAYLVRLVTPLGGVVLDPFCGSGPTIWAAREYGFRAIGCDLEREYMQDTVKRLRQEVLPFSLPAAEEAADR